MLKTFDSKEAIPAALQSAALETKDGKWVVSEAPEAEGLKAANAQLAKEKREAAEALAAMQTALGGLKPEDIARTVNESRQKEEEAARKAGKFDELREKAVREALEKVQPDIEAGRKAIADLASMRLDRHIDDAMDKAGVATEDRGTVRAVLKATGRAKLDEKGNPVAFDKDGDPVSGPLDAYIGGAWKNENKKFFEGSGSSGGGANNNGKPADSAIKGAAKVSATDEKGFLANIDAIAKGETVVTFGS